jgi:ketol-acid reductoisomerase
MRLYHDADADLGLLQDHQIAVIGYGNQGRAQALNLRDSGLSVIVGNQEDGYGQLAREEGFSVSAIDDASAGADVVVLLIPDEVAAAVFEQSIAPHLAEGNTLVFATGYNIAFGYITPPPFVDVILVAPRMIGAGVRDLYVAGSGFPSFIGVAQDHSGQAKAQALALAKGIGSTRAGVVEVTFAQEAELDLFTEQCFGPAFGHVLTTAVDLLLDEGYPPEAVLLELYMSGEFSYTLAKIAELGIVEQASLHSPTSQYGSMSRGMRFMIPEIRTKMRQGLDEIRSGRFAEEWMAEQEAGTPALQALREAARSLPLHKLEQELLQLLRGRTGTPAFLGASDPAGDNVQTQPSPAVPGKAASVAKASKAEVGGAVGWFSRVLGRIRGPVGRRDQSPTDAGPLSRDQMEHVLGRFLASMAQDAALLDYSEGRQVTMHYTLTDSDLEFTIGFHDGQVSAAMGPPAEPAEVQLETTSEVLDGMFTGRINAMRAAMSGRLGFSGEARLAVGIQQIQEDLKRLYSKARGS